MADHVQSLVRSGERRANEVSEVAALLRAEQEITLSLDQEQARMNGLDLDRDPPADQGRHQHPRLPPRSLHLALDDPLTPPALAQGAT